MRSSRLLNELRFAIAPSKLIALAMTCVTASVGMMSLPTLAHAEVIGACGTPIPAHQSRRAGNFQLVCGGGASRYIRTPERFDMAAWSRLERQGRRDEMLRMRQSTSNVQWSGEISYATYDTWTYWTRQSGRNAQRCGTTQVPYSCQEPVYERRCFEVPDAPSVSSPSGGGHYSPSAPGQERRNSAPREERRSAFPSQRDPNATECRDVQTGTRTTTCYRTEANFCEWEEEHSVSRHCSNEKLSYKIRMEKPDANWAPGRDPRFLDILPNKYDLLPGEWEEFTLISNLGRGSQIRPRIDIENAWNRYQADFSASAFRCEKNSPQSLEVSVRTVERIKRKSPNAFALPVDRQGRVREALAREQIGLDSAQFGAGEPYSIRLQDTSNAMILAAARQSRRFENLDGEVATVAQGPEALSVRESGFWKDTQFRVRLILKESIGRNVRISQDLVTHSGVVQSEGDEVLLSLQGENGVNSFYRASGPLEAVLGGFWGQTRYRLQPGRHYELRIAMMQRGLPFYESGCDSGDAQCEGEAANHRFFSEDLVIDFQADSRVDQRGYWQRFVDWHRRPLWQKFIPW
ncbi:MAG TPA: hypothetical protein PLZ57_11220 [Pseudobdellovibrionaceae bacterium]|nr:hypothetical protein [Pseudobdellovibrionaceae bacterium]